MDIETIHSFLDANKKAFLTNRHGLHATKNFYYWLNTGHTMWGSFNMLSLSVLVALVAHMAHTQVVCPWDDNGLELWSSPATWPSGQVPQFNDSVLIPFGKKLFLLFTLRVCVWFTCH